MSIRIGTSPLSNRIYAGKLNKKGNEWLSKTDVTNEACGAVIEHVVNNKAPVTVSVGGIPRYKIIVEELNND